MGRAENAGRSPRRRKRNYGVGSIYQDKHGQWWLAIRQNGTQKRTRCASEQDAKTKRKALTEQKDRGVTIGAARVALRAYLETWLTNVVAPNAKPKTYQSYHQVCEDYISPRIGNTRLDQLTPDHIRAMLAQLDADGFAPQTCKTAYTVLHTALQQAVDDRKLVFNPAASVKPPNVPKKKVVPLTTSEASAIRWAVEGHRLAVLYDLALSLGCRKAELLGLTIAGVDLDAATITIAQQVLDLDGKPSIEPYTKNDQIRTLPLTPRLVARVRARMAQLMNERGPAWKEHGLLFPSERGTPMSERNLDRHWKAALKRADVRDIPFHWMRHSVASWLNDCGMPRDTIKSILGHASEGVTGGYIHVPMATMRQAIEALEGAAGEAKKEATG